MGCGALTAAVRYEHKFKHSQPTPLEFVESKSEKGTFARENLILTNTGIVDEVYEMKRGKTLGVGGFGSVCKGTNKATGAVRAIKSIVKSRTDEKQFAIEVDIMRSLDHPNIVKLYETFEDAKCYYLILELCQGGELMDAVTASHTGFSEKVAAKIVKQMVGAVSYMHSRSIAHRDLKPENFLLADNSGVASSLLKMTDFGLSKACPVGGKLTSKSGTLTYAAPEVLKGDYTVQCDVWSLGVLTYVLLSGHPPFQGSPDRISVQVMRGSYSFGGLRWSDVSDDAKDLISKMIVVNPDERLTAAQVFKHPWVEALAPNASDRPLAEEVLGRLKGFQAAQKFEQAVLSVMAVQLKDEEVKTLRDLFYALDKDGSGTISAEELKTCFVEKLNIDVPPDLADVMSAIDSDGSGEIDYTEFIVRMMDKRKFIQKDVCWAAFRVFDLDGDGVISEQELAKVISGGRRADMEHVLGVERDEIERIFKGTDTDGTGSIDFDEFFKMMQGVAAKTSGDDLPPPTNPLKAASGKTVLS